MRKFVCALLSVSMLLSGYARADASVALKNKAAKSKKCLFPKSGKRAPAWVCNAQADGFALTAVGAAPKSKAGLAFMEQMAEADARAKLARDMRRSERGNSAINAVAAESENTAELKGCKVLKRAYGPNGTLYLLMAADAAEMPEPK